MRIFIVECPNPMDLLQERTELQSLEKICKLFRHEVYTFLVKSSAEFKRVLRYISTIDGDVNNKKDNDEPLCIHISAHGYDDGSGLVFGADDLEWEDLTKALLPIMKEDIQYKGSKILIISACYANKQKITKEINKKKNNIRDGLTPIKYIFIADEDEVKWQDAVVAWTILYHQLPHSDLDKPDTVKSLIRKMKESGFGNITYFRWDEERERYRKNPKKKPKKKNK